MADAKSAEDARVSTGIGGASPMPKGCYDPECGHFNLVSVERLPIDDELRTFVREFRETEPEQRNKLRQLISMDEFYTLIQFAKRSAALALVEESPEPCEDGLAALALIDERRIDSRDAAWAAGLLSYAAERTANNKKQLFKSAMEIATPGLGKILRRSNGAANLADWGYAEICTKIGSGLIPSGWASYRPTVPLTEIALAIAGWLDAGRYATEVEIAVDVPEVWFQEDCRVEAKSVLACANAAALVKGTLRSGYGDEPTAQMFLLWLVDLPAVKKAEALVGYSGCQLAGRFSVGFSVGRLFCHLVAGSVVEGMQPYESKGSLNDLVDAIGSEIEVAWALSEP